MDPAGTQRALSNQGQLLGNHEQAIEVIQHNLAALSHSVIELSQNVSRLVAAQVPSGPASTLVSPAESYACNPEPFDGNLDRCRGFIMQCELVFAQRPRAFLSDQSRINYILGLLRGAALEWAQASNSSQPLNTLSLAVFLSRFRRVFDRPDHAGCASDRLFSVRQGARSVAEYSVEFCTLAAEAGWNDPALQTAFRRGLSDTVRDAIALGERPTSLNALIDRSIELDNYQRERRRERALRRFPPRSPPPRRPSPPRASPPPDPRADSEEPMQLGRARLSSSERRRRLSAGACLYCGQAGHFLAACPSRPKD